MRLINLDAFRADYELREHCEECGRYGKKDCDYASYSARDFCGWLDDAPTVDAVPLDKLCEWLAVCTDDPPCISLRGYDCGKVCREKKPSDAECWKTVINNWMEGLDGNK